MVKHKKRNTIHSHTFKKNNQTEPKVSVIIPVYNTEKYLQECLDSVVNQTLKEIEIICVDDGSTDNSLKILKEYAAKDNRIQVLTQTNQGAGPARNLGIKNAKGEFVCFMDGDDYYPTTDILKTLYTKAKENNVLICGGEFSSFTNQDRTLNQNYSKDSQKYLFPKDELIYYKDYQFNYGYTRFIYSKKMLIENNIFFPPYRRYQDPPFFVKAMIQAEKFYAVHKITYAYRKNHKSVDWTNERINGLLNGILDNIKTAEKNNLTTLKLSTYKHLSDHMRQIEKKLTNEHHELIKKIQSYLPNNYDEFLKPRTPFYQKIFSIKNSTDKRHKIVRLFGLRIKIKRKKFGGCSFVEHILSIKNSKNKRYKIIRILGIRLKIRNNRGIQKISKKIHKSGQKIVHAFTKPIRVHQKYEQLKQEYKRLKKMR